MPPPARRDPTHPTARADTAAHSPATTCCDRTDCFSARRHGGPDQLATGRGRLRQRRAPHPDDCGPGTLDAARGASPDRRWLRSSSDILFRSRQPSCRGTTGLGFVNAVLAAYSRSGPAGCDRVENGAPERHSGGCNGLREPLPKRPSDVRGCVACTPRTVSAFSGP